MTGVYSGDTPQPKDTVHCGFDAEYQGQASGGPVRVIVVKDGHRAAITLPDGATVEVLERADDPSKDLTGSIRRTKTVTCIARERDGGADFHRWIAVEVNEAFTDDHMRGSHVIGAVPGTPAAEAEQHPVDGRPPMHVDNEAIVTGQYYTEKTHPQAGDAS